MPSSLLVYAILISIAAAWLNGVRAFVLTYRNRKLWRNHYRQPAPLMETYPRVTLIIPCKWMEHRLRENLTAFVHQDHPNFEVSFVVESDDDSAVNLIRNIMRENPHVRSRLLVAGRAVDCGQKVHNLLFAINQLEAASEVIAFADSDSCPKTSWLRWLVVGIDTEQMGARTGHRWLIPCGRNFATLLGCTLNNSLVTLLGRNRRTQLWGGSWAIHRHVFNAIGLREAWHSVLNDDLVATRILLSSGLKIEFEPRAVCTSRVQFSNTGLIKYLRRQFIVQRRYSPIRWLTDASVNFLTQLGYWGGLVLGIVTLSQGDLSGCWYLASSVLLYALGIVQAVVRQNMGRMVSSEWRKYRKIRKFDIAMWPLAVLLNELMRFGSSFGSKIKWRGIRYQIDRGGRVLLLGRKLNSPVLPIIKFRAVATEQNDQTESAPHSETRRAA